MKTVNDMLAELALAKLDGVKFVTYGHSDLGVAVPIVDAIKDIASMEDEQIGEGTWFACDEHGEVV